MQDPGAAPPKPNRKARRAEASKNLEGKLTLTIKEASKLLGISYERGLAAAAAGQLPLVRLGKRRAVSVAGLQRMLAEAKPATEAAY